MRKNSLLSVLIECIYPLTVNGIILEPKLFENKVKKHLIFSAIQCIMVVAVISGS